MESFRLFKRSRLDIDAAAGLECLLHANRPLRLARARGRRIQCLSGCAWITAPGTVEDVFLHEGDAWEIGTAGLVLVEAVGVATVAIDAAGDQPMSPST